MKRNKLFIQENQGTACSMGGRHTYALTSGWHTLLRTMMLCLLCVIGMGEMWGADTYTMSLIGQTASSNKVTKTENDVTITLSGTKISTTSSSLSLYGGSTAYTYTLGITDGYTIKSVSVTFSNETKSGWPVSFTQEMTIGGVESGNSFNLTSNTFDVINTSTIINTTGEAKCTVFNITYAPKDYTVTLDQQDGTGGISSVTATYTSAMPTITDLPSKTGYDFQGYYDGSGNKYYNADGTSAKAWDKTSATTLYASWKAISYDIDYTLHDGTVTTANPSTYTIESSFTLNNPSKPGYTFTGWTGTDITEGPSKTVSVSGKTGDREYEANYSNNTYTIEYDANGGSGTMTDSETHTYGTKFYLTKNTFDAPANRKFNNWNTKSDGSGTTYTDGQYVDIATTNDGDVVTLYAQWVTDNQRTITFNAGEGKSSIDTKVYNIGDEYGTLPTAERAGYTLDGWYTEEGTTPVKSTDIVSGNLTLYAHWTANTYTVNYAGNGNTSGSTASSSHTYDVAKALTANGFAKTGYHFNVWKDDNSNTYVDGQEVKNLTTTNKGEVTLTAQWEANTYYIAYNPNGGTGSMTATTCSYNEKKSLTQNTFTNTGYTFAGWNTKVDGTGTSYADNAEIENLTTENGETINLYAQWTAIVTLTLNGGSETKKWNNGDAITYSGNASTSGTEYTLTVQDGYTLSSYDIVFKGTASVGLFESYTITYSQSQDGASVTSSAEASKGSVSDVSGNASVSFKTASQTHKFKLTSSSSSYTSASITSLVAKCTANSYTITYDGNGSTEGSMDDAACTYDKSYALTTNAFKKTGYTFTGWTYTKADGSTETLTDGATVKNLTATNGGTVTLKAQWTPNTYNIAYDANKGTGTMDGTACTYDADATLTKNAFTREGYIFAGWNTESDGSGTGYTDGAKVKNLTAEDGATVTLYAQWVEGQKTEDGKNIVFSGDATDEKIEAAKTAIGATANTLVYVNGTYSGNQNNVIVKDDDDYKCNSLVLTDQVALSVPTTFNADKITYERKTGETITTLAKGKYATIYVPYVFDPGDFKVMKFSSYDSTTGVVNFEYVDADEIEPNIPYIIRPNNGTEEDLAFNLANSTNVAITTTAEKSLAGFYGTYETKTLNGNDGYYGFSATTGTFKLANKTSGTSIKPFRAYFWDGTESPTTSKNSTLGFSEDGGEDPTAIEAVNQVTDAMNNGEDLYDLNGRKVITPQSGQIYIMGGKKIMFK